MTLILTEKPSVARDFAKALNCTGHKGYYSSASTLVTYALGHLLTPLMPEDLNSNYANWRDISYLPMLPKPFRHKVIEQSREQLEIIKALFSQKIDRVIIATDAGREGELIGRLILDYCGFNQKSQIVRFWESQALSPQVVLQGLEHLHPIEEFDHIYEAALGRQYADWIIGLNYSRLLSYKMKGSFSFGRVQSAVLYRVYQRDQSIKQFKSHDFYRLQASFHTNGSTVTALYHHEEKSQFSKKEFLNPVLSVIMQHKKAIITSIILSPKSIKSPRLLNLTHLQKEMNSLYGFTAEQTLTLAQSLYERHKVLSYPRTPSRVLGEDNLSLVQSSIKLLSSSYPAWFKGLDQSLINTNNSHVFNNKLLEDHHALIPLALLPSCVTPDERLLYDHVVKSFAMVFYPSYLYQSVSLSLNCADYLFNTHGKIISQIGWRSLYQNQEEDNEEEAIFPDLALGEHLVIDGALIEHKKSKGLSHFTESSLLSVMENPKSFLSHDTPTDSYSKIVGLGTPATRADIIETLIKRGYIEREKKRLLCSSKGAVFCQTVEKIESLSPFLNAEQTSIWENMLDTEPLKFRETIEQSLVKSFKPISSIDIKQYRAPRASIGLCPLCGGTVAEFTKSYSCQSYEDNGCRFTITKEIMGASISLKEAITLLKGNKTRLRKLLHRDGCPFKAKLVINLGRLTFTDKE